MTRESILMQYQYEFLSTLKSVPNIGKLFEKIFMKDSFDWFSFNEHLVEKRLTGSRKAIAVAPSYIPKSGMKTPWTGYFWSGCAGEYKHGQEIMGIGVIDVDNRECMTLGSVQTLDTRPLDNMYKSLIDWYPDEGRADKWQLYFSTDQTQSEADVLEYYRTHFQLEFYFRGSKQYAGITNCQSTDFRTLVFHFNASLTAINLAKVASKRMEIKYSIS